MNGFLTTILSLLLIGCGGASDSTDPSENGSDSSETSTDTGDDPLAEGLVGHWPFDEGEGTTSADVAGGTTATLEGGASWIEGAIENAVALDGVDGYVDCGDILNDLEMPVTLSAWVNVPEDAEGDGVHLFATDDNADAYFGYHWYVALPDLTVEVKFGGGVLGPTGRRSKHSDAAVDPDTWVHVAAVLRGAEDMDIYIDGEDAGGTYSGEGSDMVHDAAPMTVGRYLFGDQYSSGGFDDLRIYDRALTPDEISRLADR